MHKITTKFDANINSYVVYLPIFVTLDALQLWGAVFVSELEGHSDSIGLLFDTNTHDFESIDCLKWLKEFLTQNKVVTNSIYKVAFVQPAVYRKPEVISGSEAYFSNVKDAGEWIKLGWYQAS